MRLNGADGIANSVDPDQTAPSGLHCLPRPVCPKIKDHYGTLSTPLRPSRTIPQHLLLKASSWLPAYPSFPWPACKASLWPWCCVERLPSIPPVSCVTLQEFHHRDRHQMCLLHQEFLKTNEKRDLSSMRFEIFQVYMRSHSKGSNVCHFVWDFHKFPVLCAKTVKALDRLWRCAGSPEPSLFTYGPRHEKTCLCPMLTTKTQISRQVRAVWSAPLLFAAWVVLYLYLLSPKFQDSS